MESLNNIYKSLDGNIEICEMQDGDLGGRTKIVMTALEICPDINSWNTNGICWLENYVVDNLKSFESAPLVVSWLDEALQIPSDHGTMHFDDEGNVSFNGVAVGSIQSVKIEDMVLDSITKRVVKVEGVLYNQRYPLFVKWLKENIQNGNVYGSVEICGKGKTKCIQYLNGNKNPDGTAKIGRVPTIYDFSGLAILSNIVEPADYASRVLEINQSTKNKEGKPIMDEKIIELNQTIADKTVEINSLTTKNTELSEAITNANKTVEELNAKIDSMTVELNSANEELNVFKTEKAEAELNAKKSEVKTYFDVEIPKNKFSEEEVNSLTHFVEDIDLVGLKNAESELCTKKFKEMMAIDKQNENQIEEEAETNSKATYNFIAFHEKEMKVVKDEFPTFFKE